MFLAIIGDVQLGWGALIIIKLFWIELIITAVIAGLLFLIEVVRVLKKPNSTLTHPS